MARQVAGTTLEVPMPGPDEALCAVAQLDCRLATVWSRGQPHGGRGAR